MKDINHITLEDNISTKDNIYTGGLWAKTEVLYGTGYHHNRLGKSTLDEVFGSDHNMVPISGTQSVLQYLFGVKGPINISTLYDEMGIIG